MDGGRVWFGGRKDYTHKKKDGSTNSCRFVCFKEGLRKPDKHDRKTVNPRLETRTNCRARLGLKNVVEKMVVHEFVEEHNHDLHLQETIHMLSSQRKVSELHCNEIDLVYDDGLQQRKSFQFDE